MNFFITSGLLELQHWISLNNLYDDSVGMREEQFDVCIHIILPDLHIASECFLLSLIHISN